MIYEFRKAMMGDLEEIATLIEEARGFLKEQGINQWQGEYPNKESAAEDIESGAGYVIEENGEIVAVAALLFGEEPNYKEIDGAWLSDEAYATIHRVAVSRHHRGKGLAREMILRLSSIAREAGMGDALIPMQITKQCRRCWRTPGLLFAVL
ncbi:MAG: GNAT family N-acetyltransferase [Christensenellaceae bacterium]|jgi:GNAT superfamily N-acetyltransferase